MHDHLIIQNILYFILLGISMQSVSTNQNIAKLLVNQQVTKVDFMTRANIQCSISTVTSDYKHIRAKTGVFAALNKKKKLGSP